MHKAAQVKQHVASVSFVAAYQGAGLESADVVHVLALSEVLMPNPVYAHEG